MESHLYIGNSNNLIRDTYDSTKINLRILSRSEVKRHKARACSSLVSPKVTETEASVRTERQHSTANGRKPSSVLSWSGIRGYSDLKHKYSQCIWRKTLIISDVNPPTLAIAKQPNAKPGSTSLPQHTLHYQSEAISY